MSRDVDEADLPVHFAAISTMAAALMAMHDKAVCEQYLDELSERQA